MKLFRGKMEEIIENKVKTKQWKNASTHDSYEAADKKRKTLLAQHKNSNNFLVKVKRCGTAGNNYVVKTYTEENIESKYAKKKREKAKRRQNKQDG
tara:strand:- start:170 stop:457 length:288 start_codon:yes stop_codon:yes gene_type:complete